MNNTFRSVIVCDFEYECPAGGLPNVVCMVAQVLDENLQHVRTIRLWQGEFGPTPAFDIGPDSLFVAYSAQAELTCFKVLGWKFPVHVFDQHTAYLAASNVLLPYEPDKEKRAARKKLLGGKGLEAGCRAYGLHGWIGINKDAIRTAIGEGTWRGRYSPQEIVDYCCEDVRLEVELLRMQLCPQALLPAADIPRTLWWSGYSSKAVALIQAKGMPIDVPLYTDMLDNRLVVIDALRRQYDPSYRDADPIWSAEGKWSDVRFERWLIRSGIPWWPRLESGRLNLEGDTFRMMSHYPGIASIYACREALTFIRRDLPIGADGRNRPSLMPFCTATGRNAHSKSIYNTHAGLRSFMVAPPGKMLVYLDWKAQEVAVAAALSQDSALLSAYRGGDIYHALARVCNLTADPDPAHWKKHNPDQRQLMKALQLGINYGMGLKTLSRSLNCHPLIAAGILDQHKRTYRRFHEWRDGVGDAAVVNRQIQTQFGWTLRLSSDPNPRTLFNFPMQGNGAEMLRLAAMRLCDAGIVPAMLVHDAILLEVDNLEQIAHAKQIMQQAGRDVCHGLDVGVDGDDKPLMSGMHYADQREDAKRLWGVMVQTLDMVRTAPRRAVA
jgi:DNA polymerase I